jgi:phosphatidylinositol alpha-1,6-mannosyltransferase
MPCREIVKDDLVDAEGFGIVFLEAAASGCPVIAGRSGGTEDAVIDGETGFLVTPTDVDAVAAATIRLLTDEPLAVQLGLQGRTRVERAFTWDKIAKAVERTLVQGIEEYDTAT